MAENINPTATEATEATTQTEPAATEQATQEPGKGQKKAEKTFTQAEVDKIVQERLERQQKANDEKQAEAAKLAAMNEKERTDYQIKQLTAELEAYKAKENRAAMAKEAGAMLAEKGLAGIPDELIDHLIRDDAEQTKKAVDDFATVYSAAVESAVKARLAGTTPKTGAKPNTITRAEILAIKDRKERQRQIAQHMDLFNTK
jgi:hypothetical protein